MRLKSASLALAILVASGCQQKPTMPPGDTKSLMAGQVQPTSQIFWDSVRYISDASGFHKIEPKTDADWNRTLASATALRELGQTLKSPAYANGRGTDWQDFAQGLSDVAGQAEQAARERNPDKVFEVGSSIYNVCSACHEIYMPVPGGFAPTGTMPSAPAKPS